MNFANYRHKLRRPNKSDYIATYAYKKGQVTIDTLSRTERGLLRKEGWLLEDAFDKDSYNEDIETYRKKRKALIQQFKDDLFDDLQYSDNPKLGGPICMIVLLFAVIALCCPMVRS